jgi:hypothetical protein
MYTFRKVRTIEFSDLRQISRSRVEYFVYRGERFFRVRRATNISSVVL